MEDLVQCKPIERVYHSHKYLDCLHNAKNEIYTLLESECIYIKSSSICEMYGLDIEFICIYKFGALYKMMLISSVESGPSTPSTPSTPLSFKSNSTHLITPLLLIDIVTDSLVKSHTQNEFSIYDKNFKKLTFRY